MNYGMISFISGVLIGSALSIENISLQNYDSKVCNNEPTCNFVNQPDLLESRRTLEGRDCMCDSDCVEYGDCCADSEFYTIAPNGTRKNYFCPQNWKIYMITSCPAEYTNQAVISKCLASLKPLEGPDNSVIRPATNLKTRTNYGNIYCAVCNNEIEVTLWNLTAACGEAPAGYLDPTTPTPPTQISTVTQIIERSTQPESKIKPSQNEILKTTEKNKITSTPAPAKTSKPIISLSLGSNPSLEISLGNKTFKPTLPTLPTLNTGGFFRHKRQQPGIDFNKYRNDLDNILEKVHYDNNVKRYVSQYNSKSFICEFSSEMPQGFDTNVRKCVNNVISSCPSNINQETVQRCLSNTAIVYDKESKQAYKNRDCAKCNGLMEGSFNGCPPKKQRTSGSVIFSTGDKGATPPCDQPEIANSPLCKARR